MLIFINRYACCIPKHTLRCEHNPNAKTTQVVATRHTIATITKDGKHFYRFFTATNEYCIYYKCFTHFSLAKWKSLQILSSKNIFAYCLRLPYFPVDINSNISHNLWKLWNLYLFSQLFSIQFF